MPKVSIVMSIYNQEVFLKKSINSILEQTFGDFELIIINDRSTDKSGQIIENFAAKDKRIKIINNLRWLGLTKSLNRGIRISRGKYVARMDGDDISLKERLKKQYNFMEKNKDFVFCGTNAILIDKNGRQLKKTNFPENYLSIRKKVMHFCPFIHSTLFFRKNIFKKIGFYNESFTFCQDYELILRIIRKYKAINIRTPLLLYRIATENGISTKNLKEQQSLALMARWLAMTKYQYSFWESWKMIKPAISNLLPSKIKLILFKIFFWNLRD